MKEIYSSILAPCIYGLIEQKRACGFSYKSEAAMLRRFDSLCTDYGLSEVSLPQGLTEEWSLQNRNENLNTRNHRISLIRQLGKYMESLGFPAYIPKMCAAGEKSVQHILSHEELVSLFQVIDGQIPDHRHPRRFIEEEKILFRLFYCCGLRLSEGLYLKREHIDLGQGILKILHSKGDKDRLVFLPDDLNRLCRDYYGYICMECPGSPWLFPGKEPDKPFAHCTFPVNFKRYWERTPYAKSCNKYPTIHSLRHTFVVDRINGWMLDGIELKPMLPYLSRYLGHSSVKDTLYYYHLVDKAFQVVRQKDGQMKNIIPEVTPYEK